MSQFDTIFRQYDIRGVYGEDLTDEMAELIGRAFGTYIKQKGETKTIVGMDNRISSPRLEKSVIKGICSTGVDVVDIGTVITPIFYYSTICLGISSGVMVTASHNPAEYNGFKIQFKGRTLYGTELQDIKELAVKAFFEHGTGGCAYRPVVDEYIGMIAEKVHLGGRKLKVVLDAGNGTAGLFAPSVFEKLGCEVIPLYCDSDPAFPHHFPDPTRVDNMLDLIRSVRENHADVGLGFDGDGDRLGVVDERGEIIWGDKLMVLFWREILPQISGGGCHR